MTEKIEKTEKGELFHYTQCGLDNIYLQNGYTMRETSYGDGFSIADIDELHDAIAEHIVFSEHAIRGQEFRFLRSWLQLSQELAGNLVGGKRRDTIAKWEQKRETAIDGGSDRILRVIVASKLNGCETIAEILDLCSKIDKAQYGDAVFVETSNGWGSLKAA